MQWRGDVAASDSNVILALTCSLEYIRSVCSEIEGDRFCEAENGKLKAEMVLLRRRRKKREEAVWSGGEEGPARQSVC